MQKEIEDKADQEIKCPACKKTEHEKIEGDFGSTEFKCKQCQTKWSQML